MKDKSDYRKIGLVGEGQFGKVYNAIHRYTGELVALKQLNPQNISTKKFLNEIHILLTLQHPNIVQYYGIEHEEDKRYLVTEYCEGGTLRDLLNSDRILSIEYKLKIILDILDGLNYIHSENIIHRDLKPENILLCVNTQGWVAKISDFGVAKIKAKSTNLDSNTIGDTGSPAYMAPEQFYGKYSPSSDIYSMGIILFELLFNRRPFLGSPMDIMTGHLNQTPHIRDSLLPSLKDILVKTLAKLPSNRFRTAEYMRREILRATLSLPNIRNSFYVQIPDKFINYDLLSSEIIDNEICFLAVNNYCLYQASKNNLTVDLYYFEPKTQQYKFNQEGIYGFARQIIELQLIEFGCLFITRSLAEKNSYAISSFQDELNHLIEWKTNYLTYGCSYNLTWLAINKIVIYDDSFQLINLADSSLINTPIINFIPKQILCLNSNQGVAIYTQKDFNPQHTYFRFFNSQGDWDDSYIIPLKVSKVIHHPLFLYTFLTREKQTNNLLLIKFYPYSILRIPLHFRADFYVVTQTGFICASEDGEIAFIDNLGNYLGQFNLQADLIAIASINADVFVVIINRNGQKIRQFYRQKQYLE